MQSLWAETLAIDADLIGLDDAFVKLGGDSIAAIRLVATARANRYQLKVADIFKHPTLKDMSAVISPTQETIV